MIEIGTIKHFETRIDLIRLGGLWNIIKKKNNNKEKTEKNTFLKFKEDGKKIKKMSVWNEK